MKRDMLNHLEGLIAGKTPSSVRVYATVGRFEDFEGFIAPVSRGAGTKTHRVVITVAYRADGCREISAAESCRRGPFASRGQIVEGSPTCERCAAKR